MQDLTNRQIEIIEKSIDLIAEHGIHGLTIKNISKSIGISEPAIYRHFNSKNDIVLAILRQLKNDIYSVFQDLDEMQISEIERIERFFDSHCRRFVDNPSLASVIFSENLFQNNNVLAGEIAALMTDTIKRMRIIIEEGQKIGEIRHDIKSRQLTLLIIGSLRLLVEKWQISGYKFDLVEEGKELVKALKTLIVIEDK